MSLAVHSAWPDSSLHALPDAFRDDSAAARDVSVAINHRRQISAAQRAASLKGGCGTCSAVPARHAANDTTRSAIAANFVLGMRKCTASTPKDAPAFSTR